jgi:hypothetical protein
MNSDEISQFLCLAGGRDNISFNFCNFDSPKLKHIYDVPAWTSPDGTIYINQIEWDKCDKDYQLFVLLHEIGHVKDKTIYSKNISMREYRAQRYAMNRAKKMKMYKLYSFIKKLFKMWEYMYDWNTPFRRYILASKIAKKKGIL